MNWRWYLYVPLYFFPLAVSANLSAFPDLTFSEVEAYAQKESGCRHTIKGYKFFAEPGYLHDVKGEFSCSKNINCEYTHTFLFESCLVVDVFLIHTIDLRCVFSSLYSILRAGFCQHYCQVPSVNEKEWTPSSTLRNCCSWLKSHFWKVLLCGRPWGLSQSCCWPPVLFGTLQATGLFFSSRRLNMYEHEREVEHSKRTQNWKSRSPKCLGQETTAWG